MPTALMLTLRPLRTAKLPTSLGRAAHAAILAQIGAADETLAARLHGAEGIKPLTVSNLLGLDGHGGSAPVTPASTYGLRVTLLCERLEALAGGWTAGTIGPLTLDGVAWQVERVTADAAVHPWAGRESYESLAAAALRRIDGAPTRWTLEFVSPLTFRHGRINQPLPLPGLVFGSLLDRWNTFAPLPLPVEVRAAADELLVNNFALRSVPARTVDSPRRAAQLEAGAIAR